MALVTESIELLQVGERERERLFNFTADSHHVLASILANEHVVAHEEMIDGVIQSVMNSMGVSRSRNR
jgi:hypothetical protein